MKKIALSKIMAIGTWHFLVTALAAMVISLVTSCVKEDPEPVRPLQIGMEYGGGILYYLDSSGQHGLIAAMNDQNPSAPWWNGTFVATNAKSATNGFENTKQIVSVQGNGHYAASICNDYAGGGLGDWFLPSKDQLNELYIYSQKWLPGAIFGGQYWTSTEHDTGEAWVQDFANGQQYTDNTSDGANVRTKAIRAF